MYTGFYILAKILLSVDITQTQLFLLLFVEFTEWKDKIEQEESASFTKKTGNKGEVQYYQCNRGGLYKHSGTGKRRTKSQGNCAINHCLIFFRKHPSASGQENVTQKIN
jgi:hypothetical protein